MAAPSGGRERRRLSYFQSCTALWCLTCLSPYAVKRAHGKPPSLMAVDEACYRQHRLQAEASGTVFKGDVPAECILNAPIDDNITWSEGLSQEQAAKDKDWFHLHEQVCIPQSGDFVRTRAEDSDRTPQHNEVAVKRVASCQKARCSFPAKNPSKRLALALRGGSFRMGFNYDKDQCGPSSFEVQEATARALKENIMPYFKQSGYEVDVFIVTFACPTSRPEAANYIKEFCGWLDAVVCDAFDPRAEGLDTHGEQLQGRYQEAVLRHVRAHSFANNFEYDYVFGARADALFVRGFEENFLAGVPKGMDELIKRAIVIADFFVFAFPGCFLPCAILSLHDGCFEASPYGDFRAVCLLEMKKAGQNIPKTAKIPWVPNNGMLHEPNFVDVNLLFHHPPKKPYQKRDVLKWNMARVQLMWPPGFKRPRPNGDDYMPYHYDPPMTTDNVVGWSGKTNGDKEIDPPWSRPVGVQNQR